MKSFGAIKTFLPAWQAEHARQAERVISERTAARNRDQERLQREYDDYCRKTTFEYLEQMTPTERNEIRAQAVAICSVDFTSDTPMFKTVVTNKERKLAAERIQLPSFQNWLDLRK